MEPLPPETPAGMNILGQLPGFIAGLVSSAFIAVPLYLKQKREAAESERRVILAIQKQQQQDAGLAPMIASTMAMISGGYEQLLGQFKELRDQFDLVVQSANYDRALPLAQPYTAVARAIAAEKAKRLLVRRPTDLVLSVEILRETHASLFPSGFELGGQLRKTQVWIGSPGSTPKTAAYVPPPAVDVPVQLDALISAWNAKLPLLATATEFERLDAIARFHHGFVSIHPFLDGNGILARLVTSRQLAKLLTIEVALVESDEAYIRALRAADGGDLGPLREYLLRPAAGDRAV